MKPLQMVVWCALALIAANGLAGCKDDDTVTPPPSTTASTLAVFAGNMGGIGNADGTGAAARFSNPEGLAEASSGNFYVADISNHTIRQITPAGVVTTFAGMAGTSGSADGTGTAASFNSPTGLAFDGTGSLYVADRNNHTIRQITPAGVVTTVAGMVGVAGSADGTGTAASFNFPNGLALASSGNLYVADRNNHTIRQITPAGVVTTFAGMAGVAGSADGTGTAASFNFPNGLAFASSGDLYVTDRTNRTIRQITPAGVVTTFAGMVGVAGSADGTGTAASFNNPVGLAFDGSGNLYATDGAIIRRVTSAGVVTTLAGTAAVTGSADDTGTAASFKGPGSLAFDVNGNLFVADVSNQTIRQITPAGVVTTFAGMVGVAGSADGTGTAASFNSPQALAFDGSGNLYVAELFNHTIRQITPAGVVTTFAGMVGVAGSADGTGTAASFNNPVGLAFASSGDLYVTDRTNKTIRQITPAGVVTTFAGMVGVTGSADGTGTAASFSSITGIAIDSSDNLYVSDDPTIRKITPAGVVTTFAGMAGTSGSADGTGAAASLSTPRGLAFDNSGNLYATDGVIIRKVTAAGEVTTVAGVAGQSGFQAGPVPGVLGAMSRVAISGDSLYVTLYNGVAVITPLP